MNIIILSKMYLGYLRQALLATFFIISSAFQPGLPQQRQNSASYQLTSSCLQASSTNTIDTVQLYDASTRRSAYKANIAQYMVDLNDSRATFDFCGGMMFEFKLSDKLRARLLEVAAGEDGASPQPFVADSTKRRMHQVEGYEKSADADNTVYFHGREIRNVPDAAGSRGFVLQLSDSSDDPEGWSPEEVKTYDGWGHDSSRQWRKTGDWESEGVSMREKVGRNDRFSSVSSSLVISHHFINFVTLFPS